MPTKVAINGFGRIGQLTAKRILDKHPKLEIVAINDLRNKSVLLKDFARDPVYGPYNKKLKAVFFREKDPEKLPWKKLGIDIVIESSGFFRDKKGAEKHLLAGAKRVVISASAKSEKIPTYVLGTNTAKGVSDKEKIVSMASCTTNAVCPVALVLDKSFGIKNGFINTIHSYTVSQNKLYPNWQNRKASELNIIPATTGATKSVEKCLPQLQGKLNGQALRVPTATVSIVDFTVLLKKSATAQEINNALVTASKTPALKGILKVESASKISSDYIADTHSSIVASHLTQVFGNLAKVLIWYDNEYGYATRIPEFIESIQKA